MKGWLSEKTWRLMLASMPIPCVDTICVNDKGEILWGWRIIPPYKNVWALIGGRILRGESPETAAKRHLAEFGIKAQSLEQNGAYSVNCRWKNDIDIGFVAKGVNEPTTTGTEFNRFMWKKVDTLQLAWIHSSHVGGVYQKMFDSALNKGLI